MIFTETFADINSSCFNLHSESPSRATSFSKDLCSYQDLIIIDKLEKARFPIFLVYSPSMDKHFAMKVFPWSEGKISSYYLNELTFASISHPNIISIVSTEFKNDAMLGDSMKAISYTLMEYAPYGDFYDLLMTIKVPFDEKLARTYMHQLMDGLEHIHSKGVAHLDLKLENLLLGEDFQLKIADFDHAYIKGQNPIYTKGTVCYRAPEMIKGSCSDSEAADVYSASIILFLFKTGGMLPHCEQNSYQGKNLFQLLNRNKSAFWEAHCQIQNKDFEFFDQDFRELFNAMTQIDPSKRARISDVKNSAWYNGPTYSKYEVMSIMKIFFE